MGIQLREADAQINWFQPPRLRTLADEGERHASWLELFFDLVFVVAITELSQYLVADHSAGGFLRFAALFVPVWVAWQGYMAYATRFDTDDLGFRLAYFGAMLAIAAMAVLIGDVAHGSHSGAFAVSYVVLRTIMLLLYWRAWLAVPEARVLIRFSWRYVVWIVAQVVELSLPPLSTRLHRRIPTSASHLPERWALFTLIVLGESVVAVAVATAGAHWHFTSAAAAVLGFAAVAAIWWLYFDRQAGTALRGSTMAVVVYSYAHLPLLIGLAAMSAGLRLLIERAGDDQLGTGASVAFLGGAVLFLLSLIATRLVTVRRSHRRGVSVKLGAAVLILGLLAVESLVPPLAVAAGLAGVLGSFVFVERMLWRPS